jgi:putative transposase
VATPQEDAFIESFHSIVERELVSRHQWGSLAELVDLMARYIYFHNDERLHGSLSNVSPNQFVRQWSKQQTREEMVVLQATSVAEELAIPVQLIGG